MITRNVIELTLPVLMLAGRTSAQIPSTWKPQDVISYFCSRWYHQSVIKDDILHLYGGVQTFNVPGLNTSSSNNTLGYNPFMLQLDLKQSWDWQKNISWLAFETTPNLKTGSSVRQAMVSGSLFHGPYSSPEVWTYGGTIFRGNETFLNSVNPDAFRDQSNIYPLWSFDNKTNTWDQFDIGTLNTPSYGSSAEAPDQGLAFYLHGRINNGTNIGAKYTGDIEVLLNGMVAIDLVHRTAKNISTANMKDPQPRLGGGLQYVPGIGENGLLVALGGKVFDGLQPVTSQSRGRLLRFDDVDVFDLASNPATEGNSSWYSQSTSGDIPPARIDSCTVIASAPDNSSHNIYMYGGWDPTNEIPKYYDDMYVLSLPSFTWVKMFEGESPRYGHTCHLAAGRQLLTLGGRTQHGNVTDLCDWEAESIAIMDLPTMTWGSVFSAGYRPYELSSKLIEKLGGTAQGNATVTTPVHGWPSESFGRIMRTSRVYSDMNGTLEVFESSRRTTEGMSSRTRVTIIASTTVTCTAILAVVALFVCLRHKRRSNAAKTTPPANTAEPSYEVEERAKFELSPDGKQVYEMTGDGYMHEATDGAVRVEADRSNVVPRAFELPAYNFAEKKKLESPLAKVPSPTSTEVTPDVRSDAHDYCGKKVEDMV
ncbi:cell wall anchored protein [Stagonosporopsis vannaccii]|nr:cell wall anchored protein [Stagonosporopsis vannaccii]